MAKILCIENYKSILQRLSDRIGKMGFEVVSAFTEVEGLRKLEKNGISLIILDPINIQETARKFFKELTLRGINAPVLILLTKSQYEKSIKVIKQYPTLIPIIKRIDDEGLKYKINQVLKQQQQLENPSTNPSDHELLSRTLSSTQQQSNILFSKIQQLTERLNIYQSKYRELEIQNTSMEEFTYIISHDIREPLRSISNALRYLKEDYGTQLDEMANNYIQFAEEGAQRLEDMISSLSSFIRVQESIEFEIVDTNDLIETVKKQLALLIQEEGVFLEVEELPEVYAHKYQLLQVFQNLITNAIRYRSEKPPYIKVGCKEEGDFWKFYVQDNGIGIKPEYQNRIFEVFQRLHSYDTIQGTGLGLSICQKAIARHGGELSLESDGKTGSTFYFTIAKPINWEDREDEPIGYQQTDTPIVE